MASYRPPYPPPPPPPPHQPYSYPPPRDKEAPKQTTHHRPQVENSGVKTETEEERRLRKKKELRQQIKKSHKSSVLERKPKPLLTTEKVENRLHKPTTFVCKFKFRNELPDQTAPLKLMTIKQDKDQYTKYSITSLEKLWKPKIFVEPDLGIPLDLLDLGVYNPPNVKTPLAPEDEALLRDDDAVTPSKKDGFRRKQRPTDLGVSWLMKTEYISAVNNESTRQSLTEKQAKKLRETKGGGINILHDLDNREKQIKDIEASFEASKTPPVHATNKNLQPVEVLPLLPYFDRYNDQFVVGSFDNAPTADSQVFGKLNSLLRDEYESRAILKSYVVAGPDSNNPDKFLAYMVPSMDETSKDIHEDVSYTWVREYHWDHVRGDDTYLVSFDDGTAKYLPLHTKLNLRKKRAREGRSSNEIEHFPVPSKVTVRRRIN